MRTILMQNQSEKNTDPEIIKEINQISKAAAKVLIQNPKAKIFVPMHDGEQWSIWDALGGVSYSVEEFESRFGYAPKLTQASSVRQMVVVKKRKKDFWEL